MSRKRPDKYEADALAEDESLLDQLRADEKQAALTAEAQAAKDAREDAEILAEAQEYVETPEPERFTTGGATADEIAAWRAAHGA